MKNKTNNTIKQPPIRSKFAYTPPVLILTYQKSYNGLLTGEVSGETRFSFRSLT
jgi:hypothetical protein